MPLKFIVTDRSGIKAGVLARSAYMVISIHDPGSPKPAVKKQSGLWAVLQIMFHDAEPTTSTALSAQVTLMTPEQAKTVWEFVQKHKNDVGTVVVHCEAGMSRSPAVAAALCKGLGGNDRQFFRRYQPNMHVYRLMLEAARARTAE